MGIFEHNPYTNIHNMNLDWMINTVQESAEDSSRARDIAESMEDDVETAMTNASTALTTANSAASDASLALNTANNALNTASSAQSTANTAQSTANTALTNAASAQTTASAAQSTANSAVTAAANALTEAASKLPSAYAIYDGTVNLLKLNISSQSSMPGVTHTVNSNGTITLNGEATSDSSLLLGSIDTVLNETYTLSGATGGSENTYYLRFAMHPVLYDYGSGDTDTCDSAYESNVYLIVKNGTVFDNVTISPMVRFEAVESTFRKHVSTNEELEDAVDDKLDAPASAGTAGQVLTLNSNLAPVWADASGGGSSEWVQIADITLDEAVQTISITTDTNGNAFSLSEVIMYADVFYTESTGYNYYKVLANNEQIIGGNISLKDSGNGYRFADFKLYCLDGAIVDQYQAADLSGFTAGSVKQYMGFSTAFSGGKITSLSVTHAGTGANAGTFDVGCVVKVWGR